MSGSYFLYGFILEKCGNFWKNGCFSGRIWPDWGNTAWADMARLGSIGLKNVLRGLNLPCQSLTHGHKAALHGIDTSPVLNHFGLKLVKTHVLFAR